MRQTSQSAAIPLSPAGEMARAPDLSEAAISGLMRHPRFDSAMLSAATATVELYRGHWILNRLVNDRGRFVLGLMILDLHFKAGGGDGFTGGQLRLLAGLNGVCSPGRITALLAGLRLAGFLAPVAADDRRLRRLAPTHRFIDLHRERWRRHFAALGQLCPEGESALAMLGSDAFIGSFAHVLVSTYRRGFRMVAFVPELRSIAERDAGLTMLFSLLVADAAGQPVSIAALARRFAVSRAHVLMVLREAQQAGLVVPTGPRGGYRAAPTLATALRRFFATLFLVQRHGIRSVSAAGVAPA
jgi:biotin operon repressor